MSTTDNLWLYDYTLGFLQNPGWMIPLQSFLDEHCSIFEDREENRFEYTEVYRNCQQKSVSMPSLSKLDQAIFQIILDRGFVEG